MFAAQFLSTVLGHPMRGAWTVYSNALRTHPLRTNIVRAYFSFFPICHVYATHSALVMTPCVRSLPRPQAES